MNLVEKDLRSVASAAVFSGDEVILVANRKHHTVTLPAGHILKGESALNAARRELAEEAGVDLEENDLMFVTRLRRSAKKFDAIFAAQLPEKVETSPGGDADSADWKPIDRLPPLMFRHDQAIRLAQSALRIPPEKRGLLIVFEGIDGSGKSTQISLLSDFLEHNAYAFTLTRWNSSDLVKDAISRSKKERRLSPALYFLLHAADMIDRHDGIIIPALRRNEIVVCDRYFYTGLVRDGLRGIDREYNRSIYQKVREPDMVIHFKVEPNVAITRLARGKGLSYYGSGMDIGLGKSKEASALAYAQKMDELYDEVLPEHTLSLDASGDESAVHEQVMTALAPMIREKFGSGDLLEARELVEQLLQG